MKKIIAILMITAMLVSAMAITAAAADPVNVFAEWENIWYRKDFNEWEGNGNWGHYKAAAGKRVEMLNDGVLSAGPWDAAGTHANKVYTHSTAAAFARSSAKVVDLDGNEVEQSEYTLLTAGHSFTESRNVDTVVLYLGSAPAACFSNFDVVIGYLANKDDEKLTWKVVGTVNDLYTDGVQYDEYTRRIELTFDPIEMYAIQFACKQPNGVGGGDNGDSTSYNSLAIAELEIYKTGTYTPTQTGTTTTAPVETTGAPVETTAAPVETTAAPVETTAAGTTAPTQAPETADLSVIVLAAAALSLTVVLAIRRRVRG